jgi:acyl carrier protein
MEDIRTNLREIFVKALRLQIDAAEIGDTNLIATLGIDSISALEILIWVEDKFNILIEDTDLSPALVDSLDILVSYIQSKQ